MRTLTIVLALLAPAIAGAEPKPPTTVTLPAQTFTAEHAQTAQVLYFNRCRGGCTVTKSAQDDVRTRATTIPGGPIGAQFTLTEFRHGDAVWNQIMQCLREVYSPYNVMITDVPPAPGVAYNENIVAGSDGDINYSAGGVSPVTGDCSPFSYVISYTFANDYNPDPLQLCYVAAQETGHAFGMADHSYSFQSDNRSACSDPMSYRQDCLSKGQRFFRNEAAFCGEFSQKTCNCSGMNSHLKLISALGPGQSIIPAPALTITSPAQGAVNPPEIVATASSKRGVARVELWLNGHKWGEKKGVPFGSTNQPEAPYSLPIPAEVPNSILDVVVVAKDDIGTATSSQTLTVTKGARCVDASGCLAGMKCEEGKCFWDPAIGEVGDTCTYPQYCLSGICLGLDGDGTDMKCSQGCVPNVEDSCPVDFECIASTATSGACWPKTEDPGCCSANREAAAQSSLLALGLVLVLRRRRKR